MGAPGRPESPFPDIGALTVVVLRLLVPHVRSPLICDARRVREGAAGPGGEEDVLLEPHGAPELDVYHLPDLQRQDGEESGGFLGVGSARVYFRA